MPKKINGQADLDMRAARERLAQFQASARRELDDVALNEQAELLRKVRECYTPKVLQCIVDAIPYGSIAAKQEVANTFIEAAGIMVTKRAEYATDTRHRRLTEQAELRQTNENLIWFAYNLLQPQTIDPEHVEAWLSVLSKGYCGLFSSAATLPDAMSKHEIGARIAKDFYKGTDLSADERRKVVMAFEESPDWQQGLLQLLLLVHSANMHVIDDKDVGISGSRGAPPRIDLRAGVTFVAGSCDKHLGTWLLADQWDKEKPKQYTWFLSLCEEGFVIPLTRLLGKMSMVSTVNSVLYRKGRKNEG
jgi:hypothetical protein